jgi:predicted dehydrogenase
MKALVIGLGSIARKHISALRLVAPHAEIYALRSSDGSHEEGVKNIYTWLDVPSDIAFVIISNPTSNHASTIKRSIALNVPLFIEKPPLMSLTGSDEILRLIQANKIVTYTAFNLRFHPVIKWLKQRLDVSRVREVQAYCGSYLPNWRSGDYRKNYSAQSSLGGGVHLDLIHELDYLIWLFGMPAMTKSDFGKISDLEIDSVDSAHYYLIYDTRRVSVLLNYFRRDSKRQIEIVMDDDTWIADLLSGVVKNSKGESLTTFNYSIADTYAEQMEYFLNCINEKGILMNDFSESLQTLKLCLHDA